jgi:apolipoprotein N-acyltransferase
MNNKTTKNVLYLIIGAFFFFFSTGRYSFALATWLFPIFFLQVSRKQSNIYSCLIIPIVVGLSCQLAFWKFTYDDPSNILFYLPFILGLPMGLLYFLDKLLFVQNDGFGSTLIFPVLYTSFDFLLNLFNPFGTLGVLGYSQFDFLAFSQLASITGMWGLTFMISWFGSVAYWVLENYTNINKIRRGIIIYGLILLSILVYGSLRLTMPLADKTVRVAGIHTHDKRIEGFKMNDFLEKKDTISFKKQSNLIVQKLIDETIRQSNAGAKIVVWSEISTKILKKDEDSLTTIFKNLAKKQQIYLLTNIYYISQNSNIKYSKSSPEKLVNPGKGLEPKVKNENKALLFSPDGQILLTHFKYGGNFMEGTTQGDKGIKAVKTAYGNLSTIICWDGDFPSNVKQVGNLNTSILFVPASDWEQIDPAHGIVTVFRGIENGCSVVRQTRNGLSIMTDPRGKIIAFMDHFKTDSWVNVGQVPTEKWFTIYPIIGDLVGWMSFLGVFYFVYGRLKKNKLSKN